MLDRRTFMSFIAAAAAVPRAVWAQAGSKKVALYASVGAVLTQYDVDVDGLTLTARGSVTLPANVQYAWPHVSHRVLYVATSSSAAGTGPAGTVHHVSAFRIDPTSGALTPHGSPIALPTRPIHITTDVPSAHVLVAFNHPSALRVYRINSDATLGEEVQQPGAFDFGIYGHQVRVSPNNRLAILVARGNDAANNTPEDPGSLNVFNYRDGVLCEKRAHRSRLPAHPGSIMARCASQPPHPAWRFSRLTLLPTSSSARSTRGGASRLVKNWRSSATPLARW
ncbi:MAG: beta-propeller fold lactonase family protein [Acidobacteria bacterium]|nr:beta-propeller fold lactonase family protein [Acidobacteriota bacterium]